MIGFAIIGCGRIARKHFEAIQALSGGSVIAVCDRSAERADSAGRRLGVPAYTETERMLSEQKGRVDVVSILTESGSHARLIETVARHGKHVVVEKPMALRYGDAVAAEKACGNAGVKLFVVHQNRYNAAVRALCDAVEAGRFGRIHTITSRMRWRRMQEYYDHDTWRGTWADDGGVFANQGYHFLDAMLCVGGPVRSVYARGFRALARIEAEDSGVALFEFVSGANGIIEATTACRPRDIEGSLSVLGELGTVELGGYAMNRVLHYEFEEEGPGDAAIRAIDEDDGSVYGKGHRRFLERVIACVADGDVAPLAPAEGVRAVEIVAAIYESMARKMTVTLPAEQRLSRLGIGLAPRLEVESAQNDVEPRCYTNNQVDIIWQRADSHHVWDQGGRSLIDWTAGVLVANVGNGHPEVRRAIVDQATSGVLFSYSFPSPLRRRLAQKLVSLVPRGSDKVIFWSSGSEAVECALKLALARDKSKNKLVSFHHAYHGTTMGAQLLSGWPHLKEWLGERDQRFVQVDYPDGFRVKDTSFERFLMALREARIEPSRIAAVFFEPYLGGGGSFAPQEYVAALSEFCARNDTLLIFDEIQSGFGRTGRMFAFEHYGVAPDLLLVGKGLTASLPMSAVIGRHEVLDLFPPGQLGSTHGGNPICCAAALASVETMIGEGLVERAARVGDLLGRQLRERLLAQSRVGAIHGRGLVYGVHLVKAGSDEPDAEFARSVVRRCSSNGLLLIMPIGFGGATIKICPPLTIDVASIERGVEVLVEAIKA